MGRNNGSLASTHIATPAENLKTLQRFSRHQIDCSSNETKRLALEARDVKVFATRDSEAKPWLSRRLKRSAEDCEQQRRFCYELAGQHRNARMLDLTEVFHRPVSTNYMTRSADCSFHRFVQDEPPDVS